MVASDGYRLVLFLAWIATVLDLVLRIFKKSQSTDTLGVALVKLLVMGYLLGSNLATDVPIYILALVIGISQIFMLVSTLSPMFSTAKTKFDLVFVSY